MDDRFTDKWKDRKIKQSADKARTEGSEFIRIDWLHIQKVS